MLQGRFADCFLDVVYKYNGGVPQPQSFTALLCRRRTPQARIVAFGGLMSRKDAVSIDHGP
jgi:hypothetical protein